MVKKNRKARRFLETEAQIIAENDTHAVVAVRVEKAFFSRNLSVLASLAKIIVLGEPTS